MKNKLSKKKLIVLLILPIMILVDIFACIILYFFEPLDYVEADFSQSNYTFELYNKFSYDKNPDFYIKQITSNDIVSYEKDSRLKYVDDTIMLICNESTTADDVYSLISSDNGKICGYISDINLYQIEFLNTNYEQLMNICSEYTESEFVLASCVDYFEETPPSYEESENYTEYSMFDFSYMDTINYPYNMQFDSDVVIGIFDSLVDKSNKHFNIINADDYKQEWLNDQQYKHSIFHGSHVAGIASCSSSSQTPSVYPDAPIVSENAFNNSISYWIAAITNMIVNYNTKAINISMGYNPFVTLSANLGCENALSYIKNESFFFEKFMEKLIDADYEFLICIAAGNDSGATINKIPSHYFSYGDKKLLNKFDIFNLFTKKVKHADAKYSLPFTYIENEKVREHIITVGSCNSNKELTHFSDIGSSVDIIAPGEDIWSIVPNNEYDISSGTSMAAPFVTGAAALIFSLNESLTAGEVKDILINTSTDKIIGYGYEYPLLNVSAAVETVK